MTDIKNKANIQSTSRVLTQKEVRSLDEYRKIYFPKDTIDADIMKIDEKDPYHLGVLLFEKSLKSFFKK